MNALKRYSASCFILTLSVFLSFVIVTHAQNTGNAEAKGITFPVAELGNCTDKASCMKYCDDSANMTACISFAKAHGLMNSDEVKQAEKFRDRIQTGKGPGGCTSPEACRAFCADVNNLETCTKFAEENGFKDDRIEGSKRLVEYRKSGGKMPGDCKSKTECEAYCHDLTHEEECRAFAEKIGAPPPPDVARAKKLIELTNKGETPGKCTTKEACEAYCRDQSHFEECVSFAERAGLVKADEATKIRQAGRKGPGGCDSPEACKAYCAEESHHEECFKFAEEHGFLPPEEVKRAKESFVRVRQGFDQMPAEVVACIKSALGETVIEDVQSGKAVPSPEMSEQVQACFKKFGAQSAPTEVFKKAPASVLNCVREKLGTEFSKIQSGQEAANAQTADTIRVCNEKIKFQDPTAGRTPNTKPFNFAEFVKSAPAEVAVCLRESLGSDFDRFSSGDTNIGAEVKQRVNACFEKFKPKPMMREMPKPPVSGIQLSPRHLECAKQVLTEETYMRLLRGEKPTSDLMVKINACLGVFKDEFLPESTSTVEPPPRSDVMCAQVITPAQDPMTGACKQFPTPCDVPSGWIRGCETPANSGTLTP